MDNTSRKSLLSNVHILYTAEIFYKHSRNKILFILTSYSVLSELTASDAPVPECGGDRLQGGPERRPPSAGAVATRQVHGEEQDCPRSTEPRSEQRRVEHGVQTRLGTGSRRG